MNAAKSLVLVAAAVGCSVLAGATGAHADFVMTLSTGGSSVSITDGGAGDINALDGAITFSGALDGFIVNVTTGISQPVLGGVDSAEMDLNSVNVLGSGAGTLTIELTDTDFLLAAGDAILESFIGGTLPLGSSLTAEQCLDFENAEFACPDGADVLATNGEFDSGAFSSEVIVPFSSDGTTFSITERVVVNLTGPGAVSFNFSSTARVPEPGTLVLLGTGLAGLGAVGVWRARRKRQARRE